MLMVAPSALRTCREPTASRRSPLTRRSRSTCSWAERGVPAPDVVVVVADALHLERNLFLVSQVMELGRPTVVALNQIDAAEAAGVRIDIPELIHELGVTVIPTVATRREGLDRLRHAVTRAPSLPLPARRFGWPPRHWRRWNGGFASVASPRGLRRRRAYGRSRPPCQPRDRPSPGAPP